MREPTSICAATPQAKAKLAAGWKPCENKKGCGCAVKPKRNAPAKPAAENPQG